MTKKTPSRRAGDRQTTRGIGELCYQLIAKGKTDETILKAVKAKFPDARTSLKSLAWYRAKAYKR